MGPPILSNSPAKLDHRRPGTMPRRGTPADEAHPAAPGEKRLLYEHLPGHKFDCREQAWKEAAENQLHGLGAPSGIPDCCVSSRRSVHLLRHLGVCVYGNKEN